ncbi:hypothetical protein BHYA_0149g00220 [Botrytis hyacinthi]|uniref:Uncharacterized protein n=1 Tax=Botrytis hyacinthi TaxID=278943 RepID=A0A4Z1GKB9_9HELO|nr:hypothetical protein BHYA_0149g00220 [Botrytis hyacinthi]
MVFTILMILPLTNSWLRPGIDINTFHPTTKNLGFLPSSDTLEFYDLQPAADAWITSEYSGPPTEAKGLAWDKLQAVRGLRVSRTEGAQINLPGGLQLENGDHATITGVMHNLHCLDRENSVIIIPRRVAKFQEE